jgi:glycosyltransferase involved in cell wall biosynthesis
MRVGVFGKRYPSCGIVTYCRELVGGLGARGHEVCFFYPGRVKGEPGDGWPVALRTPWFVLARRGVLARIEQELRVFEPELVHASFALGPLDWALPALCERLKVPLVVTFHVALDDRFSIPAGVSALVQRLYVASLSRCRRVIVFSEGYRHHLIRLGVPARNVSVLPNGVDTVRYRPGVSRFRAALDARLVFTFMGRLDPEKNPEALLAAFEALGWPEGVHVVMMGEGLLAARLHRRYAGRPRLHWLGQVSDERHRIDVLRGTDVFVLPSTVEGLSLALLEAMACGAVPMVTDVGADGEVVAGVGAVLDPSRITQSLTEAIEEYLAFPDAWQSLRFRARQRVLARYRLDEAFSRLENLYQRVRTAD